MVKYRKAPELSKNARDYILDRCDPLAFIMDVMNGEVTDDVRIGGKVVAKAKPTLDQRMKCAFHLSDKTTPSLKAVESNVKADVTNTNVNTSVDLSTADLDEEDRAALRMMLKKRLQDGKA